MVWTVHFISVRRAVSRSRLTWALLLLATTSGESVGAGLDAAELAAAKQTLQADVLGPSRVAIDVLAADGKRESLAVLVELGQRTRHLILVDRIGAVLSKHAEPATELLAQRRKALKRKPLALSRIARMAGSVPGEKSLALVTALTKAKSLPVAAAAVEALAVRADPASRATLIALLGSKRPAIARGAALALTALPPDDATKEALFQLASRADQVTGGAAAVALTRMPDVGEYGRRAWALLGKRAKSESFHSLTKIAIWAVDKPDPKLLAKALKSSDARVREVACDVIGAGRIKGHHARLLKLAIRDKSYRTRIAAWLALRRAGIEEVRPAIEKQIRGKGENSYWAIQCAARWPHGSLNDALQKAALDTDDRARRDLASVALGQLKGPERKRSREYFLDIWRRHRSSPRGRMAIHALGQLKDARSFKALVGLLESEKKEKHKLVILEGLERMTGHYYQPDPGVWRKWFKIVGGNVGFKPAKIDRRKNRERVQKIKELGITSETENAVERGLSWLARHQEPDGRWSGETYFDHCFGRPTCKADGGVSNSSLAYAGLATLAFQGAGHSHAEGAYRRSVERGISFQLAAMNYDGGSIDRGLAFGYEAAITCQALCDAYAQTGAKWVGKAAQRLLDHLAKVQTPAGLWRYGPRDTNADTSVMSWALMASVSAQHAGLDVPEQMLVQPAIWLDQVCQNIPPATYEILVPEQFRATSRYFQDVSRGPRGKERTYRLLTRYKKGGHSSSSMQSIAVLCRIWLGWTRAHPFCIGSANEQMAQVPGYSTGLKAGFNFYPYTWYYGSFAMYQMGGRYWTRWREGCLADLVRHQRAAGCQDGSWEIPSGQFLKGMNGGGGTAYCTPMAILALESFYRYQPYLARVSLTVAQEQDRNK